MKKIFIDKFQHSSLVTYCGIISAVIGIYFSTEGKLDVAILCLFLSGICDVFDGKFARKFNRSKHDKEFGIQIDSLADVLSFVALPMSIFLACNLRQWYELVFLIFYALSAITRLAVFNTNTSIDAIVEFYRGLPVTFAAIIFPVGYLLSTVNNSVTFNSYMIIATFITSLLFILNFKIKKP